MVVHSRIRLADCGPFKSRFSADFMSASRPKPDIQLELLESSAVDPFRSPAKLPIIQPIDIHEHDLTKPEVQ